MTSKIQNALIILGLILIAAIGYYLYTHKDTLILKNELVDNQVAANTSEFLQRLNELKVIKLEGVIFNDARFMSLKDSSKEVVQEPIGRRNPFTANN